MHRHDILGCVKDGARCIFFILRSASKEIVVRRSSSTASPVEPLGLSVLRTRIGDMGMERLLGETIKLGFQTGTLQSGIYGR